MTQKFSLILVILGLIGTSYCSIRFYLDYRRTLSDLQVAQTTSLAQKEEMNLLIGKAQVLEGKAKFLEGLVNQMDKQVQDEIRRNKELTKAYGELLAKYTASASGAIETDPLPSDGTIPTSLVFKYEDFRLKASGDYIKKTFNYTLNQTFRLKLLVTDKNYYAELKEVTPNGEVSIPLSKFQVVDSGNQAPKKVSWFNPKVDLGGILSLTQNKILTPDLGIMLGFSFSSFGDSKQLPTWRFARTEIQYSKSEARLGFTPVLLNVADHIPIFTNIWTGVGVSTSLKEIGDNNAVTISIASQL